MTNSNKQPKWHSLGNFLQAKKLKESSQLSDADQPDSPIEKLAEEQAKPENAEAEQMPPTTSYHLLPPPTNNQRLTDDPAPTKDFARVANSIARDAIPAGLFKGTSKKLYDALYQRTRGAVNSRREIRARQSDLMAWANVSRNTLREHIYHLKAVGLISARWELGDNSGAFYEVFLPEELSRKTSTIDHVNPPVNTTSYHLLPPPPPSTQKLVPPSTQFLVGGGGGYLPEESTTYGNPNTIHNTIAINTHTHTVLDFARVILGAAEEVCVCDLKTDEEEKKRWAELAQLLADELRAAAKETGPVSSPPALLTARLKRRLRKSGAPETEDGAAGEIEKPPAGKNTATGKSSTPEAGKSKFTFAQRRRYAQQQRPPLGSGWVVESGSGKYDEVIEVWIAEAERAGSSVEAARSRGGTAVDARQCPDCQGTGMYYPQGYGKGAAKCRHQRLTTDSTANANSAKTAIAGEPTGEGPNPAGEKTAESPSDASGGRKTGQRAEK